MIACGYRHPHNTLDHANSFLTEIFQAQRGHWLFACDWNANPEQGSFASTVQNLGGILVGSSGHLRSTTDTDSAWCSMSLQASKLEHLTPVSDHFGSLIELHFLRMPHSAPTWCFHDTAPFRSYDDLHKALVSDEDWHQSALSQQRWSELVQQGDSDTAWTAWSHDAEKCLAQKGVLDGRRVFRNRGSAPSLIPGESSRGPGQSIHERQLRRTIRRISEIQLLRLRNRDPPAKLLQHATSGCRNLGIHTPSQGGSWAVALQDAKDMLNAHLQDSHHLFVSKWRQKVGTFEGARKWLKRKASPPWSLTSSDFGNTSGRGPGAELLRNVWEPIFSGPQGYVPNHQGYFDRYRNYIPQNPPAVLPPLTIDLRKPPKV